MNNFEDIMYEYLTNANKKVLLQSYYQFLFINLSTER